MDQEFEVALYLRDIQNILLGAHPDSPQLLPPHVQAARSLRRGSLAGHSLLHSPNRIHEVQQAVNARKELYCRYLADVFGPFPAPDFSPDWRTDTAVSLAKQMYESRDFSAMPILADALQDACCDNEDILIHCRDATQVHVRGCWVVDLVLNKA